MTTKNICSAIFALIVCLTLGTPAGAAGTVQSVRFQCTDDPEDRVWFRSYAHELYPATQADATADAENICAARFDGEPRNAKVTFSDGSTVSLSATAAHPAAH